MSWAKRLVLLTSCCFLFVFWAVAALAADLKSEVASCFPEAPVGYEAEEEVYFDTDLGGNLLTYLKKGDEVSRDYKGEQELDITLMGKKIDSFIYAVRGQTPGCPVVDVAGRKGAVFYDEFLVVVIDEKVAVLFGFDNGWADSKAVVLPLAGKFNYDKLESLLKK